MSGKLQEYSRAMRGVEITSILLFCAFSLFLIARIHVSAIAFWQWPLLILLAALAADFLSGLVHWFADTWGSYEWPVLGPSLIRSFREHHVDPLSITRHDFVEANGATALVLLPLLTLLFIWPPASAALNLFFLAGAWLVFLTNQIHKWAHQGENNWLVRALQKGSLILPSSLHDQHHSGDHSFGYCITLGWMNRPLHRLQFFRGLERLITRLSGCQPRKEDLSLLAASGKA